MINTAPCKDCKDRHLGCHGECEKYKEFKEYRNKINEKRQEAHKEDVYEIQKHIRLKKQAMQHRIKKF